MSLPVSPGDVIGGTYVIERLLGQGGMGAVFVAHEEQLGRRVAIKFLLSDVMKNPEAVTRFEREARAAASLQSDHVTRVLSVGLHESGARYIVMELLDGEDLAVALARRGTLPVAEVIGIMVQACDALAEAHAIGIVHRDLKPANIFLARRPNGSSTVKVLDFGISKTAASATVKALTATTAVMGTPLYMCPEQLREAKMVDGRADLWALGVTMYELLTGVTPFAAEALADLCVQILLQDPQPLLSRRPDLPPALDAIVMRCLRKDPSERFATASQLAAALQAVLTAPQHAPLPPPTMNVAPFPEAHGMRGTAAMPAVSAMSAATVDPVSRTPSWLEPRRPSSLGLAIGGAVMVLVGGVTAFALRSGPSSSPATTDSTAGRHAAHGDAARDRTAASGEPASVASADASAALPSAAAASSAASASSARMPSSLSTSGVGSPTPLSRPTPPHASGQPAPTASAPWPATAPPLPSARTAPSAAPLPATGASPFPMPIERR